MAPSGVTQHERRMAQVLGRRTPADGEQILAEGLAELRRA
jgi:hypothetical protein